MRKGEELDGNANNYELMRDTIAAAATSFKESEHNSKDDVVL